MTTPTVSRRAVLSGIAASTAVPAAMAAPVSELSGLIATHEIANRNWCDACEALDEFSPSYEWYREIAVPLTIGGMQCSGTGDDLSEAEAVLRGDIGRRYAAASKLEALTRSAPDLADKARDALRKAHAADLRTMRRLVREEQAWREQTGLAQAIRASKVASDIEDTALDAVLAFRCSALDEVAAKARYIAVAMAGCVLHEDQINLLIGSMYNAEA